MNSTSPTQNTQPVNSTNAYTPGPWHVRRSGGWQIMAGEHVPIATVATGVIEGAYRTEAIEANARLIAAAPELLHVCRWLIAAMDDPQGRDLVSIPSGIETVMLETIAKAEGREP